jgi:hypothetical protein
MTYSVQIIENRVVETPDGDVSPNYFLPDTFATYVLADEAGQDETARLHQEGKRVHYAILDGRPVGHS